MRSGPSAEHLPPAASCWGLRAFKRTNGVAGSDDGAPGLQRSDDPGLGDGNALLLHGFMNTGPVCIIHLKNRKGGVGAGG